MSKRKAGEGLPFGMKGAGGKAVRFDDNVQESEDGFIGPGPLPAERKPEDAGKEDLLKQVKWGGDVREGEGYLVRSRIHRCRRRESPRKICRSR